MTAVLPSIWLEVLLSGVGLWAVCVVVLLVLGALGVTVAAFRGPSPQGTGPDAAGVLAPVGLPERAASSSAVLVGRPVSIACCPMCELQLRRLFPHVAGHHRDSIPVARPCAFCRVPTHFRSRWGDLA